MKIVFAVKRMHDIAGGAEKVLAIVSSGLAEKGYDVTLLSFDPPGTESFYPLGDRIRHVCLGIGDTGRKTTWREAVSRMQVVRQYISSERPACVIAFMHSSFVLVSFALAGLRIPVIASEHVVPQHYRDKPLEYALFVLSSFFVKRMTVISEGVKALYPRILRRKMVVIPNPVLSIMQDGATAHPALRRNVILSVGRLAPEKDQETLIRAFARICDRYPAWDLRIVGEGHLRGDLENLIQSLNIQGRVTLPGAIKDVAQEYKDAAFFVLPSLYESFGLTMIEALMAGLPVIGFEDSPGASQMIVHEKNGLLVPPRNRVENLAESMERLMQSDSLRNSLKGKAGDLITRFEPARIVSIWEQQIHAVVNS